MERKAPQSIGNVLRDLLEETSLQSRMDELKAADLWPSIVGPAIAALTSRPLVKNGKMQIGVPDAPLRQELSMNRTNLREIINKKLGKIIITDIRFTS